MPTTSLDQFVYRPELVQPGSVYRYIKSNIDGSYPARLFIYVMDRENLEVVKFESHGMDAARVRAHMDWQMFSADQLESWTLTPDGLSRPKASMSASYEDRTFAISWQGRRDVVTVEHFPVHVYNFDFISLNYSLPHWLHPHGVLRVGVLQPNFEPDPQRMMKYEGTVLIEYLSEEQRNERLCRRYRIGGEGLAGTHGLMWVNREHGYIEDMEIPVPDNPDWHDFKFRFMSAAQMLPEQWTEFANSEVLRLKFRKSRTRRVLCL